MQNDEQCKATERECFEIATQLMFRIPTLPGTTKAIPADTNTIVLQRDDCPDHEIHIEVKAIHLGHERHPNA